MSSRLSVTLLVLALRVKGLKWVQWGELESQLRWEREFPIKSNVLRVRAPERSSCRDPPVWVGDEPPAEYLSALLLKCRWLYKLHLQLLRVCDTSGASAREEKRHNHRVLRKSNAMHHNTPAINANFVKHTLPLYELVQLMSESRLHCSCTRLGNWVLFVIYFSSSQHREKFELLNPHKDKPECFIV